VRRLPSVDSYTIIPRVTETQSTHIAASPTTSFCLGPNAEGIITVTIWVMGYKYLTALKKANFDVVEAKI